MTRSRPRSQSGYTLIETLIVLVMIGLVAAIGLPRVNISRLQAKSSIQALGTTMLALQREAISRQHNIVVMVDTAGRQLRVLFDANNNLAIGTGERIRGIPLGDGIVFGRSGLVPPRSFGGAAVNFTTTETTTSLPAVVFFRNGSAREFGGLYLTSPQALAGDPNHQNETWAMELIRATGRAEWMRWNGSTWKRGF
jgi:prepilin-type N-terminal cleavage/methylation domain-containing protein